MRGSEVGLDEWSDEQHGGEMRASPDVARSRRAFVRRGGAHLRRRVEEGRRRRRWEDRRGPCRAERWAGRQ